MLPDATQARKARSGRYQYAAARPSAVTPPRTVNHRGRLPRAPHGDRRCCDERDRDRGRADEEDEPGVFDQ
jgi:hypothetical protein